MRLNWSSRRVLSAYLLIFDITDDPIDNYYEVVTRLRESHPQEAVHFEQLLKLLECRKENCEDCKSARTSGIEYCAEALQEFLEQACLRRASELHPDDPAKHMGHCMQRVDFAFMTNDADETPDSSVCNHAN